MNVNPEVDFSNNPQGGYQNPGNSNYTEVSDLKATADVAIDFLSGKGPENGLITGGNGLRQVQQLKSVQALILQGFNAILADKIKSPGEEYNGGYRIGKIYGPEGQRIIKQSLKDLFKKSLKNNEFFSAENVLGSYSFTMRVNADRTTATICVYDAKTIESLTDHLRKGGDLKRTPNSSPAMSNTYQRYIWSQPLPTKQELTATDH